MLTIKGINFRGELFDAGIAAVIVLAEMIMTEIESGNARNVPNNLGALFLMSVPPFIIVNRMTMTQREAKRWLRHARTIRAILAKDESDGAKDALSHYDTLLQASGLDGIDLDASDLAEVEA